MNVVFLFYNRPDVTSRVFERIRAAGPDRLFLVGDGAKADDPLDANRVAETRRIVERVDWPCEVVKLYADENMGCPRRVSSGLSTVFEHVEDAIILEDDCLPSTTFFRYCEDLLARYRDEPQVSMISGYTPTPDTTHKYDYYHSAFPDIWGWATWRDRWLGHFQLDISNDFSCPEIQVEFPRKFNTLFEARYWAGVFHNQANKRLNSWAYSWFFANIHGGGIGIVSCRRLIENIGLGHDLATNTTEANKEWADTSEPDELTFPLRHPPTLAVDRKWDRRNFLVRQIALPVLKPLVYAALRYRLRVYADTLLYSIRARTRRCARHLTHPTRSLQPASPPTVEAKGVFAVTGMPYSGAPAIAYLLQKAGVTMGERMTFPDFEHPGGAVVDRAFADLHDALWERNQQSQILPDPPALKEADVDSIHTILKDRDPATLWGWHEWRTLPLLPLYERMVKPLYLIGVYHDPHVVISTMRRARREDPEVKRNAAVVAEAWLRYHRLLLRAVSERPETTILLSAGQLADHPESCLRAVATKFGVSLSLEDFDEVAYRAWLPQWSVRWDVAQRMIERIYGWRFRQIIRRLRSLSLQLE